MNSKSCEQMKTRFMLSILKRKNISLLVLIFLITIINNPVILAQKITNIRASSYSAESQAEGQTRWLAKKLNFDKTVTERVYKINLKYLLQTDSLRMTTSETENKISLHNNLIQKKNTDLKVVLTSEQYSKYISIFGTIPRNNN